MNEIKILVVDDHQAHGEGLAELLSMRGFSASHVLEAETALCHLHNDSVDVILSDIHLSGMDGYELCRCVRGTPEFDHVAFIYHTASSELPDMKHEGDAFLTYPIGIDHLISVIIGCVARRSPEKRLATVSALAGIV